MLTVILTFLSAIPVIGNLAKFLLGLTGSNQPAAVQEGEKAGAQGETIQGLEQENAQLKAASAAGVAADVASVRSDPEANTVHTDPAAAVNNLPGEVFRD